MSEWFDNQKKSNRNIRKLLQERIDKSNPRRKLAKDETIKLAKLEAITTKLRRGVNVQANGLEPYAYLCNVLTRLPYTQTVEDVEALRLWSINKPVENTEH